MAAGRIAAALGKGLVAGVVGTAAMTAAQAFEMRITGRQGSDVPAQAVETVAGVEPTDEASEARLNVAAHWGYGTALGALRGVLGLTRLSAPSATGVHFAVIYGLQQAMLPALGVAEPTWRYGRQAVAMDVGFHAVYAAAAGTAYAWLDRERG